MSRQYTGQPSTAGDNFVAFNHRSAFASGGFAHHGLQPFEQVVVQGVQFVQTHHGFGSLPVCAQGAQMGGEFMRCTVNRHDGQKGRFVGMAFPAFAFQPLVEAAVVMDQWQVIALVAHEGFDGPDPGAVFCTGEEERQVVAAHRRQVRTQAGISAAGIGWAMP